MAPHARRGLIVAVPHADGSPPFRVRWLDDERETLLFPPPDAQLRTPRRGAAGDATDAAPVPWPARPVRCAASERVVGPAGDGRAALDGTRSGDEAGTRPIRSRGEEIMMDGSRSRAIVVGVDESASARDAAEWAADIAALWAAPLHLVHVVLGAPYDSPITLHPTWLNELCASAVRAGADPEDTEVIPGNTVDMLADRAAEARMLVLGSYGTGAWSGMLAGSAALAADRAGPLPGRRRPRQRTRRSHRPAAVRSSSASTERRSGRPLWSSPRISPTRSGPGSSPCTPGPTWPLTATAGCTGSPTTRRRCPSRPPHGWTQRWPRSRPSIRGCAWSGRSSVTPRCVP